MVPILDILLWSHTERYAQRMAKWRKDKIEKKAVSKRVNER